MGISSRVGRDISDRSSRLAALLLSGALVACGGGGSGPSAPPPSTIGGTVTGLAGGAQLVLLNNGANATPVGANGAFTLQGSVPSNGSYAVTVQTQPAGQTCTVTNGSGSGVTTNVTSVSVSCLSIGQFIDAPVAGLSYTCSSTSGSPAANSGTTTAQGQFLYALGQGCSFKVGNVSLGSVASVPTDAIVTPQDLAGVIRSATTSPAPLAIAQLLQSLDDGSTPGTLTLPASVTTALAALPATSITAPATGVMSQDALKGLVRAAGKTALVSPTNAAAQLQQEITSGRVKVASGAVTEKTTVTLNALVIAGDPTVPLGLQGALTATGHYTDGSTRDLTSTAIWTSSAPAVASVSAGKVSAQAQGSATLTVQSGGVSGQYALQVTPAVLQSLSLAPASPRVAAGLSTSLVLTGTYSDGSKSTSVVGVTWSSATPSIATVDAAGSVKAVATGEAAITAVVAGLSTSVTLTVLEPTIVSIVISAASNAVQVGSTLALNALANLSNGTQRNVTAAVTWVVTLLSGGSGTDATTVATVATNAATQAATITGTGLGSVTVAARSQGVSSDPIKVESLGPFAATPLLTPDLEPIYASFCMPPAQGRSMQNVVPVDLNADGRMDLVLMIWCSPITGPQVRFDGVTPSRLIALIQDAQGHFTERTAEIFGKSEIIPGGTGEYFVVGDFNADGRPDVVWSLGREDGRLMNISWGDTQAYWLNFSIMSQKDGKYKAEWFGKGWGNGLSVMDNEKGGQDFISTPFSQPSQHWTYDTLNGWVTREGYEWVGMDSAFLPRKYQQEGSRVALSTVLNQTQLGVSARILNDGKWVEGQGFYYPNSMVQKWCCGNAQPSGANFTRIAGVDYIDPSFGQTCTIRRTPAADPEILVVFEAQEIIGGYNGQVIYYYSNTTPLVELYKLMAFGVGVDGNLLKKELKISNEITREVKANRLSCFDVNGDGLDDIILFVSKNDQHPVVYLNDGSGSFNLINPALLPLSPNFGQSGLSNYIFSDIDGDGVVDLIYFPIVGSTKEKIQLHIHKGIRRLTQSDRLR